MLLVLVVARKRHGVGVVSETPSVYGCGPNIGPLATPIRALTLKSKKPRSNALRDRNTSLSGKSIRPRPSVFYLVLRSLDKQSIQIGKGSGDETISAVGDGFVWLWFVNGVALHHHGIASRR